MKKAEGFNQSRTFGVEVEFFGVTVSEVIRAISQAGLDVAFEGYTHRTTRHWKIVTDSSVTGTGTGQGKGLELVSPILKGDQGLRELEIALEALNSVGAKVDKTCGVHIHHDAQDFTIKAFQNVYGIYSRFEQTLDELFPLSRRGDRNRYCRSIKRNTYLDGITECNNISELEDFLSRHISEHQRYYKVNIASFRRHGTIEFRQHSGSTDFEKISNWIVITQAICERAVNGRVIMKQGADDWFNFKKVIRAYKWMGADDKMVKAIEFYNKRRRELAKKLGTSLTTA